MVKLGTPRDTSPRRTKCPPPADGALTRELWADRWVSYPRADRILRRPDDLLILPARVRMQNVLIHGASGAGKA